MGKPISENVSSASCVSCEVQVRQNNHYLLGNSNGFSDVKGKTKLYVEHACGLKVTIDNNTAMANVVNNAPVGVNVRMSAKFS